MSWKRACAFAIWLPGWFLVVVYEQGLGRAGQKRMSAGLVSATDAAIHTTQMQVDEVTVIRLSPIVYNKELVKRELLDQITLLSPHTQSNQWHEAYETHRNIAREQRKTAGKHASLCKYIMCTHMLSCILPGGGRGEFTKPQVTVNSQ